MKIHENTLKNQNYIKIKKQFYIVLYENRIFIFNIFWVKIGNENGNENENENK